MPDQQKAPQPASPPPPAACVHCKHVLDRGHYEIRHVNAAGQAAPHEIRVCSLLCLVHWAYNYGIRRGFQGFAMLKNIITALRGAGS